MEQVHDAPDPDHGFSAVLSSAAAGSLLAAGRHVLAVRAVGSLSSEQPTALSMESEIFVCDGVVCPKQQQ